MYLDRRCTSYCFRASNNAASGCSIYSRSETGDANSRMRSSLNEMKKQWGSNNSSVVRDVERQTECRPEPSKNGSRSYSIDDVKPPRDPGTQDPIGDYVTRVGDRDPRQ